MKWFLFCFKKYATFKGRASRAEYWWFYLVAVVALVAARGVALASPTLGQVVRPVVALALLVPHLAVGTRRLHDVGVSGWWLAAGVGVATPLIAFAGRLKDVPALALPAGFVVLGIALMLLFFLCHHGDPNPNKYGELPPATPG